MKLLLCVLLCLQLSGAFSQKRLDPRMAALYSVRVADSFDIYIDTLHLQPGAARRYVYYLDAGIRSGKELRRQLAAAPPSGNNFVFVGIGHRGDFHEKRRRDFLPGRSADRFYDFLQSELMPLLEKRYGPPAGRSLIGHSFGGLFTFYALFRSERHFDRFYALSPSLWVDRNAIFGTEARFFEQTTALPVYLYLSAGRGERFNHILAGNRRMKSVLDSRRYRGLLLDYQEHRGTGHNGQVPYSIRYLLQ